MSIIIPDIDFLIIHLLDIPELTIMVSTNKYFHDIVTKTKLYQQYWNLQHYTYKNPYYMFLRSCKKGYLEYAKSLVQRHSQLNIHDGNEHPFQLCCYSGNLAMCQWMINLGERLGTLIEIHIDDDLAFTNACTKNRINVAKWLIELGEKSYGKINIHSMYSTHKDIFTEACIRNYMEMARYLISLGETGYGKINVHQYNVFVQCQQKGNTEMVNWLLTLEPTYGVFQKD